MDKLSRQKKNTRREASVFHILYCIYKPNFVENSHLSGIFITKYLVASLPSYKYVGHGLALK